MRKFTTITVELYAFIFDRQYRSRILSPILCTLGSILYILAVCNAMSIKPSIIFRIGKICEHNR